MAPIQQTPSETNSFDTDVAIVGAGPIGLTLACALAHHGVRFRLFEKRTELSKYSKANNLWARPQELLAAVGAREALAEKSYAVSDVNVVATVRHCSNRAAPPAVPLLRCATAVRT